MKTAKLRAQLAERVAELSQKIQWIEHDAAERGFRCGGDTRRDLAENPILERAVDPLRKELLRAQSALQRLDRRELDCCIHCGRDIDIQQLEETPYAVSCPSCAENFPVSYAGQMRAQHQNLSSLLLELLEVVAHVRTRLSEGQDSRAEICAATVLFNDFGRELRKHFDSEEKDGYMAEALATAPRLQRKIEGLEHQHESMSAELEGVLRSVFDAKAVPHDWTTIQQGFQAFADEYSEHETAENRILQSAFMDDLGGG